MNRLTTLSVYVEMIGCEEALRECEGGVKSPLWRSALVEETVAEAVASRHHIPVKVAKWLCVRDVPEHAVQEWVNPTSGKWMSPEVFTDMATAVGRTLEAIARREKIYVVGDYDVDGVTSSVILACTLGELGAQYECVIPHRIHDGYGLSSSIVERVYAGKGQLLITVDNGIRAIEALARARQYGIDVIVTDHHDPGDSLPSQATALIHFAKSTSEDARFLSGAGVAWKFATALLDAYESDHQLTPPTEELRQWHLGLAALGALADVMPMRGENRSLVQCGIDFLRVCGRPGWKALCETSGLNTGKITASSLLWTITPRLNAAGRMASAEVAFHLLTSEEYHAASHFAEEIERLNDLRRSETDRAYKEAVAQCHQRYGDTQPMGIVAHGDWSLGVVGIVAAKLSQLYNCPAIVISEQDDTTLRGSGRAPDGFELLEAVTRCSDVLDHFGGHESAIGCGVHRSRLPEFIEAFQVSCSRAAAGLREDTSHFLADDFLSLSEVTSELVRWVQRFEPFGPGNPPLTFYLGPLEVVSLTPIGNGKHVRIKVREAKHVNELVWFNAPENAFHWLSGDVICAIVCLEFNSWQGVERVQIRVESAYELHQPLSREEFGYLYKLLRVRRRLRASDVQSELIHRTPEDIQVILDTFVELGFAHFDKTAYHVIERVTHRDLRESSSYQMHLRSAIGGL